MAAAVGFLDNHILSETGLAGHCRLPNTPKEKQKKEQRKSAPEKKQTKKNRLSKPAPLLLLHHARPGPVLLLRSYPPFLCRRGVWECVLGRLASPRRLRGGEGDFHPLAFCWASLFTGHTFAWERCLPRQFLHLAVTCGHGRPFLARRPSTGHRCSAVACSSLQRKHLGVLAVQRGPTRPHAQHRPQKPSGPSPPQGSTPRRRLRGRIPLLHTRLPTVSGLRKRPTRPRFPSPGSGPGHLCLQPPDIRGDPKPLVICFELISAP